MKRKLLFPFFLYFIFVMAINFIYSYFDISTSFLITIQFIFTVIYMKYLVNKTQYFVNFRGIQLHIYDGVLLLFLIVWSLLKKGITTQSVLFLLYNIFLVAAVEEYIFRDIFYTELSKDKSLVTSMIITNCLFSIIHIPVLLFSQFQIENLLFYFIFGMILSTVKIYYNNLVLIILLHAINNIAGTNYFVFCLLLLLTFKGIKNFKEM